METIKEGKQFLRENFEQGCKCPVCGQGVKLYKRKLNSGMALFLIGLYRLNQKSERWFHHSSMVMKEMSINTSSLDYSVMKHWGIIEPRGAAPGEQQKTGYWRITEKGKQFLRQEITIPRSVNLFNNKRYGFSEEHTTIKKALGDKFDLDELLKG